MSEKIKKTRRRGLNLLNTQIIDSHRALAKAGKGPKSGFEKLFDGGNLYLFITSEGYAYWRFRFIENGKEQLISFGVYPDISLREARDRAVEARKSLKAGIRPLGTYQVKSAPPAPGQMTFQIVCEKWFEEWKIDCSPITVRQKMNRIKRYLYPVIGEIPFDKIEYDNIAPIAKELTDQKKNIEGGTLDKLFDSLAQIKDFAKFENPEIEGWVTMDKIISSLKKKYKRPQSVTNYPSVITVPALRDVIQKINKHVGKCPEEYIIFIRLLTMFFCRPGELICAKFEDFKHGIWYQPQPEKKAEKGKAIIPLPTQALEHLITLERAKNNGPDPTNKYLFPSYVKPGNHLNLETIQRLMRTKFELKGEQSLHGFRATARSILEEFEFEFNILEKQLAHEQPKVVKAYAQSPLIMRRVKMLQFWADLLDGLWNDIPDKDLPNPKSEKYQI